MSQTHSVKFGFGKNTRMWSAKVKISEFETDEGQNGILVIVDVKGHNKSMRRIGVSLQHPDEEYDYRRGVRAAILRANPLLGKRIYNALRQAWRDEAIDEQFRILQDPSKNARERLQMARAALVASLNSLGFTTLHREES